MFTDLYVADAHFSLMCEHREPLLDFALVDVDGDGFGELLAIVASDRPERDHHVVVLDGCSIRYVLFDSRSIGLAGFSPVQLAVADFDGDGQSEVFVGWGRRSATSAGVDVVAAVFELDGTVVWLNSEPVEVQQSTPNEVLAVDLNGDGAYEVIGAGGRVFDGRTGRVLESLAAHSISEWWAPLLYFVADLDGDGSTELIVQHPDAEGGIEVFSAAERWASGPSCWAHRPFNGVNLGPDCEIPLDPLPPWKAGNTYRAAPPAKAPVVDHGADLTARFVDVCEHECDEHRIRLGVQVGNLGLRPIRDPVVLEVYGLKDGQRELLAVERVPEVPATTWVEGFDLWLPSDGGYDDLEAVVTIDGAAVRQCDLDNDVVRLGRPVCRP
jgi:hypothetical protein